MRRIDLAALSKRVRQRCLEKVEQSPEGGTRGARWMSEEENSGQGDNPLGPYTGCVSDMWEGQ